MIIYEIIEFHRLLRNNQPIIAIDYGQKKLGFAISNQQYTIAMPIKTVCAIGDKDKISAALSLIHQYLACGVVIGLPISMDGSSGKQVKLVESFANILSAETDIPIYLQDERLTSRAADNLLRSFGLTRKQRNQSDDPIAASMILETTLNVIKNSL